MSYNFPKPFPWAQAKRPVSNSTAIAAPSGFTPQYPSQSMSMDAAINLYWRLKKINLSCVYTIGGASPRSISYSTQDIPPAEILFPRGIEGIIYFLRGYKVAAAWPIPFFNPSLIFADFAFAYIGTPPATEEIVTYNGGPFGFTKKTLIYEGLSVSGVNFFWIASYATYSGISTTGPWFDSGNAITLTGAAITLEFHP